MQNNIGDMMFKMDFGDIWSTKEIDRSPPGIFLKVPSTKRMIFDAYWFQP